jgi:hypothetical protein
METVGGGLIVCDFVARPGRRPQHVHDEIQNQYNAINHHQSIDYRSTQSDVVLTLCDFDHRFKLIVQLNPVTASLYRLGWL